MLNLLSKTRIFVKLPIVMTTALSVTFTYKKQNFIPQNSRSESQNFLKFLNQNMEFSSNNRKFLPTTAVFQQFSAYTLFRF